MFKKNCLETDSIIELTEVKKLQSFHKLVLLSNIMVINSAINWFSFLSFTLKRDHHRDKEQLNQPGSKIRLWEAKNNPFKKEFRKFRKRQREGQPTILRVPPSFWQTFMAAGKARGAGIRRCQGVFGLQTLAMTVAIILIEIRSNINTNTKTRTCFRESSCSTFSTLPTTW